MERNTLIHKTLKPIKHLVPTTMEHWIWPTCATLRSRLVWLNAQVLWSKAQWLQSGSQLSAAQLSADRPSLNPSQSFWSKSLFSFKPTTTNISLSLSLSLFVARDFSPLSVLLNLSCHFSTRNSPTTSSHFQLMTHASNN